MQILLQFLLLALAVSAQETATNSTTSTDSPISINSTDSTTSTDTPKSTTAPNSTDSTISTNSPNLTPITTPLPSPVYPSPIFIPSGSPCNSTSECVPNSSCLLGLCECLPGFTVLSSQECKMDFEGPCTSDIDCNTAMGLHCSSGICNCTQGLVYLPQLGSCMSPSMSQMYMDIVLLINRTESELSRFSTLLSIFMIHSTTMASAENSQNSNPSQDLQTGASHMVEISPAVYHRLEMLQRQLNVQVHAQGSDNVAVAVPSAGNETTNEIPQGLLDQLEENVDFPSEKSDLPEVQAQQESPPTMVHTPEGFAPGTNFPPADQTREQLDPNLTSVLPNFVQMFAQFLPFLEGFNNVLSSTILKNPQGQQGQGQAGQTQDQLGQVQGQLGQLGQRGQGFGSNFLNRLRGGGGSGTAGIRPQQGEGQQGSGQGSPFSFLGGGSGSGGDDNVGGLGGLFSIPMRILQVPGRIFNSLFGQDSPVTTLAQVLSPFGLSKPIPFLPWPIG